MPQIDFGRAFADPEKHAASASADAEVAQQEFAPDPLLQDKPAEFSAGVRIRHSQWTNIIFTSVTLIGGLFCAFYFFNGDELLRAAAAWPREFLYSRPPTIRLSRDLDYTREQPSAPTLSSAASADSGGDPFAKSSRFLSLTPPSTVGSSGAGTGLPTTASIPNGRSPLAQLGFLAPGGDALMQVFNRAVADLARLSALDAHRTVVIAETAVSKNEKSASVRTKEGTKDAEHAGNKVIKQQTLPASTAAVAAQNHTNSVGNVWSNATQQMMNSTRSTLPLTGSGIRSVTDGTPVSLGGRH